MKLIIMSTILKCSDRTNEKSTASPRCSLCSVVKLLADELPLPGKRQHGEVFNFDPLVSKALDTLVGGKSGYLVVSAEGRADALDGLN